MAVNGPHFMYLHLSAFADIHNHLPNAADVATYFQYFHISKIWQFMCQKQETAEVKLELFHRAYLQPNILVVSSSFNQQRTLPILTINRFMDMLRV